MKTNLILLGQKSGLEIEIYAVKSDMTSINILNDQVMQFNIDNVTNYSIKAIKNKKFVVIHTEDLKNPEEIIKAINEIFDNQDNSNENELANGVIESIGSKEIVDYNSVKNDLLSLNELHSLDSRLKDFQISYTHYYGNESIENKNANMTNFLNYHELSFSFTASKDGENKIIYFVHVTKSYNFNVIKELVVSKIKELLFKFNSDSVKTKEYDIIITNRVMNDLLNSFISMFNAKSIYMHQSLLENKFNEKVFKDNLTIIEDPTSNNFVSTSLFDCEGTKTTYKEIIKNGVFLTKLNNIEYAIKLNEPRSGNASGVTNMYITPGKMNFSELVQKMNDGIIIDSLQGLHAGINPKTGDISLQAEARLVENGSEKVALSMILLTTNIIKLFNNIDEIGNDLLFDNLDCGSPSILFNNITITGKK